MKAIVKVALFVAKSYPVFPTTKKKMPCWSNRELGCAKGEGGFKIATQDKDEIVRLFSHPNAETVSVPMGPMSGLLAIDPDLYKGQHVVDWHSENLHWLEKTLCHETQNGGRHYFFEWTDKVRFPATLAEGVDVKGHGGYVVFPPSGGYTVLKKLPVKPFPLDVLQAAMIAKGGTGNVVHLSSYNQATDADLIANIQAATELYPALRSLAYRMPGRRQDDGTYLTEKEMISILENLMDTSVGASTGHARHDDWVDRRNKIPELVTTAMEKEKQGVGLTDAEIDAISQGESFIKAQEMIAASSRPIGPQRQSSKKDIEIRIAEMRTASMKNLVVSDTETTGDFVKLNAKELRDVVLPPIKYIIPQMLSEGGTCSIAGMSNVGKTRYMAALVMALAVGDTARLGLPQCARKISTLYVANEEHLEDMARRFKAVTLQHDDKKSADIIVRGKKAGTFRIVAVNETGQPEIDEKNVAVLVDEIRKSKAEVLALDPYVTLAEGGDENSATTASMVTRAFLLVIAMTDCAIIYPHHTPKDRSRDADAFRGSADAWRGSGAIYSSLDYGFTLCNYFPRNKDQRKAWKAQYLSANLSRFIVLDCGKIREGQAIHEKIMELVPQEMDKGEGEPIGVINVIDEATAMNALLEGSIDTIINDELSYAMVNTLGVGTHKNMAECDRLMHGHQAWPNTNKVEGKQKLLEMFGDKYNVENGSVHVLCDAKGKWRIVIEEKD
jgi:hypothetical protein